ncbi:GNAT family N-acetyltransferase [Actinomadura luteofluorescens]|uniref:GNAT family N-acetyltransferase n=1 Tax=Actinomadura luteofluorescens TaxID=46163 RepID=UPI0021649FBA|nr:GNAT family N-acetyltransferase [Actinomadura glauciflava]MCR3745390.1 Acetyltransferase (GNAT) domain-containing protein [Actinomadura glauciflava]
MEIREGGLGDAPAMLAMLDGAVAWLAANGRTGQWGSEPWSRDPRRVERITGIARDDEIWVAEVGGRPAGVMAVAPGPPHYVAPAEEPELYITLLVTDRAFAGHGVGGALIAKARGEAEAKGVGLLRVDCYGGDDGRLVEYYRGNGFETDAAFTVGDWPGRVLSQRIAR